MAPRRSCHLHGHSPEDVLLGFSLLLLFETFITKEGDGSITYSLFEE
jgi:hypothetical protein